MEQRSFAFAECVVGRAVPAYFPAINTRGTPYITMLLGTAPSDDAESEEGRRYISASPITYISADDPPFLLLHGDEDDVIPFEQAGLLSDALHEVGVGAEVLRIRGGDHGLSGGENSGEWEEAMVRWFNQYLVGN